MEKIFTDVLDSCIREWKLCVWQAINILPEAEEYRLDIVKEQWACLLLFFV